MHIYTKNTHIIVQLDQNNVNQPHSQNYLRYCESISHLNSLELGKSPDYRVITQQKFYISVNDAPDDIKSRF